MRHQRRVCRPGGWQLRVARDRGLDQGRRGLAPLIGYDAAAVIAKEAFKSGKTVRELCLEKIRAGTLKNKDSGVAVREAELSAALDPRSMTEPH